jgi:restriction system protein
VAEKETVVWGIHAGKTGAADDLFLKKNYVALGWAKMGDLSKLKADREAFKAKVLECWPDWKEGRIRNSAGQLFRFLCEMKTADFIVYPSKQTREVHIGRIEGPYKYDPNIESGYPNLRPVKWLRSFPRTHFSQGALYEIGSALSLFQVKTYAEEFLGVGGDSPPPPPKKDETVAVVVEDIEETTRDFVLKQLAQELKGYPFQEFVAHLLQAMGYRTRVSPQGTDEGVDIIAHKDELGFEPPMVKVQAKSTEGNVGDPLVSGFYGKVAPGEFGLLVALGKFTAQARSFERSKSNLRLIDGDELVDLIFQHYESFDSRYKGLIPLKRVYVPEVLKEEE